MHRKKGTQKYLFTHKSRSKDLGSKSTIEDKLYVEFKQGTGQTREAYYGVGMKSDSCKLFWPMFSDENSATKRFVACEMSSRKVLPEKLIGLDRCKWPSYYQDHPDYAYPNKIVYRFFEEPERNKQTVTLTKNKLPDTQQKLDEAGWPEVGRIYCFLYPGGAGARVEQYKNKAGVQTTIRKSADNVPHWWPEGASSWYIFQQQGGWTGPVTSFYKRIDSINAFWSYLVIYH